MPEREFTVLDAKAFLATGPRIGSREEKRLLQREQRERDRREAKRTAAVEAWQVRHARMSPHQRLEDEFAMLDEMERDSAENLQRCEQEFEKLMRAEQR